MLIRPLLASLLLLIFSETLSAAVIAVDCNGDVVWGDSAPFKVSYVFDTDKGQVQAIYPADLAVLRAGHGKIYSATITDTKLTLHITRPDDKPFFELPISRLTGDADYAIPNKEPVNVHLHCEPSNLRSFLKPILGFNSSNAMPLECRKIKFPKKGEAPPAQDEPFARRPTLYAESKELTFSSSDGTSVTFGGRINSIKPDQISLTLEGYSQNAVILNLMNGTMVSYALNYGAFNYEECRMTNIPTQRKF